MDYKRLARNIVNQLFDEAEVSVEKRQAINDKCDEFVSQLLMKEIKFKIEIGDSLRACLEDRLMCNCGCLTCCGCMKSEQKLMNLWDAS